MTAPPIPGSPRPGRPWRLVWRALDSAVAYRLFLRILGSDRFRGEYARRMIRARAGDRVLDIGCGSGEMVGYLPPVDYTGFDMNPDYVRAARRRFGDLGRFLEGSVSTGMIGALSGCDIVRANGILHHLDDAGCGILLGIAHAALRPGGRLVTLDGVFTPGQSRLERYFVSRDRGRFVRSEDAYLALARRTFAQVTPTILSGMFLLPYTHLVMECVRDP